MTRSDTGSPEVQNASLRQPDGAQGQGPEEADSTQPEEALLDSVFSPGRLAPILESLLFASGAPVSLRKLVEVLDGPTVAQVRAALELLRQEYAPGKRGIHLVEVAGGYQFRTARENAVWVQALLQEKPQRLGRATLETLAIVAYKQPVTKAEIESIRGVDCDAALNTLLARRLVKIAGRKETIGRPLLYATTPEFLETFGLKDLNDLPALQELTNALEALTVSEGRGDVSIQTSTPAIEEPTSAPAASAEDHRPGGLSLPPPGRAVDS